MTSGTEAPTEPRIRPQSPLDAMADTRTREANDSKPRKGAPSLGSNRAYIKQEIPHLEELMVDTPAEALAHASLAIVGRFIADLGR